MKNMKNVYFIKDIIKMMLVKCLIVFKMKT